MKKLLAIVISMAMIVAMMPMGVFATNEELTNYVTVDGIAGMNGQKYATISDAYNAGKNILSNATENDALGQGLLMMQLLMPYSQMEETLLGQFTVLRILMKQVSHICLHLDVVLNIIAQKDILEQ